MATLLSVRHISKSFGTRMAVDDVSFDIAQGETLGLIGPNGAGKSTTVSMICGLLRADRGEITLNGSTVAPGHSQAKRLIGLVPQDLALFEELSARENLRLFGALYGLKGNALRTRCDEVLQLVNLADRSADLAQTFSGGMKRRLNIAAALLHDPMLLILDEPTVGVDPQSRNAIFDSLDILKQQGRSLIYTSHYMEEVERLADRIVVIDHGKVLADHTPAELYQRLPAQAALHVELAEPLTPAQMQDLSNLSGVANAKEAGTTLDIALRATASAMDVMQWLQAHNAKPLHFATARSSLEEVFLTLTGRHLRD